MKSQVRNKIKKKLEKLKHITLPEKYQFHTNRLQWEKVWLNPKEFKVIIWIFNKMKEARNKFWNEFKETKNKQMKDIK